MGPPTALGEQPRQRRAARREAWQRKNAGSAGLHAALTFPGYDILIKMR
jgi:hypothetical protein